MYSDLVNIFFFFRFWFYRIDSEISFFDMRKSRLCVKRTIDIPSKSVHLFPFLVSIPNTGNHIFIAHRPSRSKTYNNQILFVKTRCNFASISPKEKEKSNSIDICLNFTNLSTSLRISSNIVLNAVITFFKNFKTFNFLRFRWQVITREENRGKNGSGGSGEIATLLTGFPAQREFFSRCFEKKKI